MYHRYSYLVGPYVHVWTDDRSCSVVHSLSHHVFSEQSILLLQDLAGESGQLGDWNVFIGGPNEQRRLINSNISVYDTCLIPGYFSVIILSMSLSKTMLTWVCSRTHTL